ncbi:stationary phase inducible protein CsiE [Serratia liquefaciens]|uniref:stationary phase inducible protein CsiE n=1 Tax=Serratia liquefaciens TaxID=614 RepID=UPI00217BB0F4|nr:stationary phase inducible protein CsiE [Serratia liquefaciens]CAI1021314.1 stationary phase inducible protein CsiE [Serratia liquefaciens]CAI1949378.1 stationary phase inducible protein CsiE [Serratia liquefaciens]
MSLDTSPVPELSGQQRRCHLLLMLYAPVPAVQLETISQINGVAPLITRQDIAEVASEIQRFHHLEIDGNPDEGYRIRGSALNQRLCLIHWLRRALRCSPEFVEHHFSQWLQQALGRGAELTPELEQCIGECEALLNRSFDRRDRQFLQHYLRFCVWENQRQRHPVFTPAQHDWLHQKPEYQAAALLHHSLNQLFTLPPVASESDFLVLTFTMLKNHSYHSNDSAEDLRLMAAIKNMVDRFQQISGMTFSSEEDLISQLFAHLAPAVERCRFEIGIDNQLLEEVERKYPRLMCTAQEALAPLEQEYDIHFSSEEAGLVAISFGAWLMQGNALQEKQVLLLTLDNPQLEEQVEYQIRELTLLPLNIKYLPLRDYLRSGAPQGITLVITPYAAEHTESEPPLIYTELPLERQQRKAIRALLETS